MLESLGHYKILDRLGSSGGAEIYRGRDTKLGRTVTIKVLPQEIARSLAMRSQILADARAATALSHPNIAALYEVGEEGDYAYLVCEYVPGEPLTAVIASHSLNVRRAIDFATQLADAVADAHAEGIAHRNLRPTTITVTPKEKVKILDFGFATWMKRPGATQAPVEEADFRADIAALGAILYEMVTGKQPPPSAPPPPSSTNPNIPKELDPIVVKALNKTGDQQYESAATLAAELRSVAAMMDVRSGDKEPPTNLPPRLESKRRIPTWILLVIALALVAGLVWFATRSV
jgi:eukaryotic-like serine/threonine-protein kinase